MIFPYKIWYNEQRPSGKQLKSVIFPNLKFIQDNDSKHSTKICEKNLYELQENNDQYQLK